MEGAKEMTSSLFGFLTTRKEMKDLPDARDHIERMMQRELEAALVKYDNEIQLQQIKTNQEEAKSPNIFVSGWRPAVGWVCVAGLGWNFILHPLLGWGWGFFQVQGDIPPDVELGPLMVLLTGMLGFGGMRSIEKIQGVARKGFKNG